MELITLFRFVEVLLDAPSGATLTFSTDLPGNAMAARSTVLIPPTSGRHSFRLSLPGACKGKLYKPSIVPAWGSALRIYAAKVYARPLGPAAAGWAWYSVPVPETSSEWQPIQLPIPQTSQDWSSLPLPIPQTSEAWQDVRLPIPQTPEDWGSMPLPVRPTPVVPDWVQVQVDT